MPKETNGGKARAAALTPEQRKEIAQVGAEARWAKHERENPPKATHSGVLKIGGKEFACAVLADGKRVISEKQFMLGMGIPRSGYASNTREENIQGCAEIPLFLASLNLAPFVPENLKKAFATPFLYLNPQSKTLTRGIQAEMVPEICEVWLQARDAKSLSPSQLIIAQAADLLMRGLAKIGIIALVDEATGYQAEREKDELQILLSKYLTEEHLKWVKTFPNEFFTQIYRLRGWRGPIGTSRSPEVGKIINKYVYERLPKGILEELQSRNPSDYETKRRRFKHHQFLTEELGHPELRTHLQQIIYLMRACHSWYQFKQLFEQANAPKSSGYPQELGIEMDEAVI